MKLARKHPWLTWSVKGNAVRVFECARCGKRERCDLPTIGVKLAVRHERAFIAQHKQCEAEPEPLPCTAGPDP
jgi:hypothetical protein